jgi:hypothetical protein
MLVCRGFIEEMTFITNFEGRRHDCKWESRGEKNFSDWCMEETKSMPKNINR